MSGPGRGGRGRSTRGRRGDRPIKVSRVRDQTAAATLAAFFASAPPPPITLTRIVLNPDTPEFSPSPPAGAGAAAAAAAAPPAPPPLPVDASHSDRMIHELTLGTYECSICLEGVVRDQAVWSCNRCFRVMHLGCFKEWRAKSGAKKKGDPYRCPGCQTVHTAVPVYRCFCSRVKNPDFNAFLTPHSCGGTCGKARPGGCPHRCEQVCHPGACPPCSASGPLKHCPCGRTTYRLRCGQKDPKQSCGAVCGKPLRCRHRDHRCTKVCHTGPCPPCAEPQTQWCYCGATSAERRCGTGAEAPRSRYVKQGESKSKTLTVPAEDGDTPYQLPVQPSLYFTPEDVARIAEEEDATDPLAGDIMSAVVTFASEPVNDGSTPLADAAPPAVCVDPEDATAAVLAAFMAVVARSDGAALLPPPPSRPNGRYSCKEVCGAWLDCGLHRCTDVCHPGDCNGCQLMPQRVNTCPCGKRNIGELDHPPRLSCLDPVATCGETCDALLPCGHTCQEPCHNGPCPPCSMPVTRTCRCGSVTQTGPCEEVLVVPAAVKLQRATSAASSRSSVSSRSSSARKKDTPAAPPLTCTKACGHILSCRRHKCRRVCCPLAGHTSEEVASVQALAASLGTSGGHASGVSAAGGGGPPRAAPPARRGPPLPQAPLEPVDGQGHNHMCVRMCGKQLPCGRHTCDNLCHLGNCPPCSVASSVPLSCRCGDTVLAPPIVCGTQPPKCTSVCRVPRPCGHQHSAFHTCHFGECPPCVVLTEKRCMGGHEVRSNIPCHITTVTCGRKCGRRMPCGVHTCTRGCHAGPCLTPDVAAALEAARAANGVAAAAEARAQFAAAPVAGQNEADAVADTVAAAVAATRVACGQTCGALLPICGHPCASPCHPGEDCPAVMCTAKVEITCACGRLAAVTQCCHGLAEPGTPAYALIRDRKLPCNAACEELSRATAFASALAVDGGEGDAGVCPYPDELLTHARDNPTLVAKVERRIRDMMADDTKDAVDMPPMTGGNRGFVHRLAEAYGLTSLSFDREPKRYARVFKRPPTASPPADASPVGVFDGGPHGVPVGELQEGVEGGGAGAAPHPGFVLPDLSKLVPMPRVPLAKAVAIWGYRLPGSTSARRNPFGADSRVSTALQRVHPTEPMMADMSSPGTQIHLFSLPATIKERRIVAAAEEVLGSDVEFRLRRVDECNAVLTFMTQGRAKRCMVLLEGAVDRGITLPFNVRWWGVGVEDHMAPGEKVSRRALPPSATAPAAPGSDWSKVVRGAKARDGVSQARGGSGGAHASSGSRFDALREGGKEQRRSAW